ncbi:MAG: hypothetical protein NWT00_05360, partial [Beijerinckiaceae bacterium]|nr:hypothetical protein [Beijerinckiaceae bacterium]
VLACGVAAILGAGAYFRFLQSDSASSGKTSSGPAGLGQQTLPPLIGKPRSLTPPQKLAATRQLIDEQLAKSPEFSAFFDRFKSAFPAAHKRILDGFVDGAVKDGRIETADLYLAQALRGLRSSHGVLAANASPEALESVFDLQATTLRALAAQDPKLCADFLFGAASQGFFRFSAANRKLVAKMAEAGLNAIIDGQKNNIERAAPSQQEFQQLEAALRKSGLQNPEVEMLLDGKIPEPVLADATVCRAGQSYFDVLTRMPDDLRMKIYALSVKLRARS